MIILYLSTVVQKYKGRLMQKQIHVNSYVKRDGTQVKEHFRNIDTDNYGTPPIAPENQNGPVLDEQDHNPLEKLFQNIFNPTMNMKSGPILQGGISVDVGLPTGGIGDVLGNIGSVLGTVVAVGLELAPIALQMYQAMNSGNGQAVKYLKPQFDTKIKQLDTQVAHIKNNIDNNITKLVNTKNQTEYFKIYEPLQKDWQVYQHASNIVNRIKIYANNNDYQSVANELGNFTSGNLEQINNNTNSKLTNFLNNINKVTNKQYVNDATEFWNASVKNLNTDYIKNNSIIIEHPNNLPSKSLTKIVQNKLHSQNLDTNTKGVIYDENSPVSIAIGKSSSFQNFVRQNYISLIYGNTVNGSIGFNPLTESNLWAAVNKIDIVYAYIDENGNIISVLLDTYDFNKFDNRPIVILGRNEQNRGNSIPYYTIINVKIPLEQWIKWFIDYKL